MGSARGLRSGECTQAMGDAQGLRYAQGQWEAKWAMLMGNGKRARAGMLSDSGKQNGL